jgi:hypothetical protein
MHLVLAIGCSKPAAIEVYTIPTKLPEQLRTDQVRERMLAAMVAKSDRVWFFKVTGPETAIDEIDSTFRQFVEQIEFADNAPDLSALPDGWRERAGDEFRFATLNVDTPTKQLDVSISHLPLQEGWDEYVKSNVNRWRGQLNLSPSEEKWAGGESLDVVAADQEGVWVDLLGEPGTSPAPMSPPFAQTHPEALMRASSAATDAERAGTAGQRASATPAQAKSDERLQFAQPDGWRVGRGGGIRLAAFWAGPEDSQAELTVIPAGGDVRGNVARWLSQVHEGEVPAEVVDKAIADAKQLEVDGHPSQRFFLTGDDPSKGEAIDATIIQLENGYSLFVKMTGPADTVAQQEDAIASFLNSLEMNL